MVLRSRESKAKTVDTGSGYLCRVLLDVQLAYFATAGCQRIYELPAGGGKQQAVAQRVRIEKVVRKKYVVNPYSAIKFEVPPIDEVRLQLQEVTAHQYTIGFGEGTEPALQVAPHEAKFA